MLLKKNKDGGKDSNTMAYWLFEIKSFCSIGLLKFDGASRDVFHSHAFDCVGFVLKGKLYEDRLNKPSRVFTIRNGFFFIYKDDYHKVSSEGISWVFTIRGKWIDEWQEVYLHKTVTLTHTRKEINVNNSGYKN